MDKEKFKQIAKQTKEVFQEVGMLPDSDAFADIVTRIYNSENINDTKKDNKPEEPKATEKQIKFLKQLGIDTENKSFTKREASKLIEEKKRNE